MTGLGLDAAVAIVKKGFDAAAPVVQQGMDAAAPIVQQGPASPLQPSAQKLGGRREG